MPSSVNISNTEFSADIYIATRPFTNCLCPLKGYDTHIKLKYLDLIMMKSKTFYIISQLYKY